MAIAEASPAPAPSPRAIPRAMLVEQRIEGRSRSPRSARAAAAPPRAAHSRSQAPPAKARQTPRRVCAGHTRSCRASLRARSPSARCRFPQAPSGKQRAAPCSSPPHAPSPSAPGGDCPPVSPHPPPHFPPEKPRDPPPAPVARRASTHSPICAVSPRPPAQGQSQTTAAPDSQFVSVPDMYPNSVTMSSALYRSGYTIGLRHACLERRRKIARRESARVRSSPKPGILAAMTNRLYCGDNFDVLRDHIESENVVLTIGRCFNQCVGERQDALVDVNEPVSSTNPNVCLKRFF